MTLWALLIAGPLMAVEAPVSFEAARRLSLEDPKSFLERSPEWLRSPYSAHDPDWRRELLLRRGRAAWMLSDRGAAQEAVQSLEELSHNAKMPQAAAYALLLRADESADFGQYETAIAQVNQAAEILRALKDPYWRALANEELCDVYWGTEQADAALPYCKRAEKYFRGASDEWHLARVENIVAMLQEASDTPDAAIATALSARQRFERLQMPSMVAMIDDNLSSLYLGRGDLAQALAVSERALKVELAAGKLNHAVSSYVNIARARSKLGQHAQALASIESALKTAESIQLRALNDTIYMAQMDVAEAAADFPLALRAARAAIDAGAELNTEQQQRAIADMEARYTAAEQKREIERLDQQQRIRELELARTQQENARQAEQLGRQRLWLWLVNVGIAALALISALLFALWRSSKKHARHMRMLAETDVLTQVYNRRAFLERLQAEFARAGASGNSSCVAIIDADHFKRINDTRGHQMGDRALKRIAAALGAQLRVGDVIGRIGGEEFALLLVGIDVAEGRRVAEQARTRVLHDHETPGGLDFAMTVSVGLAALDTAQMPQAEDWLVVADRALYQAKREGRNRVVVAGDRPMEAAVAV